MYFVILHLYSDFLTVNLIGRDTRNLIQEITKILYNNNNVIMFLRKFSQNFAKFFYFINYILKIKKNYATFYEFFYPYIYHVVLLFTHENY